MCHVININLTYFCNIISFHIITIHNHQPTKSRSLCVKMFYQIKVQIAKKQPRWVKTMIFHHNICISNHNQTWGTFITKYMTQCDTFSNVFWPESVPSLSSAVGTIDCILIWQLDESQFYCDVKFIFLHDQSIEPGIN